MKKLKFRMWDEQYKYMNYKVMVGMWGSEEVMDDENYTACMAYISPENTPYECEPGWCHFEPYQKNIKIMQYVGLKDINGKEIYEGDIIEIEDYCFGSGLIPKGKRIMVNNIRFCASIIHGKVIGNIYENPELWIK